VVYYFFGIQANVNITAPIMSRFDLFFIVLDECDQVGVACSETLCLVAMISPDSMCDLVFVCLPIHDQTVDYNIAKHIVGIHQGLVAAVQAEFSTEAIQRYIKFARRIRPQVSYGQSKTDV
jgi:DNA replication licensing factor MCM6